MTPALAAAKSLASQLPVAGGATVPMLASGTLGPADLATGQVHLPPVPLAANGRTSGGLAWWISGENRKANVSPDPKPGDANIVAWQERARAHAIPDPTEFGLAAPPDFALPTAGTMAVTSGAAATARFHDATVWSMGLLANAATGGWKRDLSLMTEKFAELPATSLPFFTVKPGVELRYSKPAPSQSTRGIAPGQPAALLVGGVFGNAGEWHHRANPAGGKLGIPGQRVPPIPVTRRPGAGQRPHRHPMVVVELVEPRHPELPV